MSYYGTFIRNTPRKMYFDFSIYQGKIMPAEHIHKIINFILKEHLFECVSNKEEAYQCLEEFVCSSLMSLSEEDEKHFTGNKAKIFNKLLGSRSKICVTAALEVIGRLGNEKNVSAVRSLCDGKGQAKQNELLQNKAQNCLKALMLKLEDRKNRQTLLRGSSNSFNHDLLMPASSKFDDPIDELLLPWTAIEETNQT